MSEEMERDEKQAGVTADVTLPAENPPGGGKRKPGGQPGNLSALKRGNRTCREGLVVARLGELHRHINFDTDMLRRAMEATLERQTQGGLSLVQRARIQTIIRLEMSCRLSEKAIKNDPAMPADQLRSHRESICRWSQQRDNALAELLGTDAAGGSASAIDPWSVVDQAAAARAAVARAGVASGGRPEAKAADESPGQGNALGAT